MEFRIASSFQDSLQKLTNIEQSVVKTTVYDLQMNPTNPGLQMHRLDKVKDQNFWSVRANQDIRVIVHRMDTNLLVCYADHHDKAYKWAETRKLEVHPRTGAAQIVELRETVKEIVVPKYVEVEQPRPALFAHCTDDDLLAYGIPESWLGAVKAVRDEDALLKLETHLPEEAFEALLVLFDGGKPEVSQPAAETSDPFEHPDAQRRFRVMTDLDELKAALEAPWEKWAIFLHPAQRQWAERDYNGPARVSGSAGTGKTVVALHRAVNIARGDSDARVLLTTFSPTLAHLLRSKLRRLVGGDAKLAERIEVHDLNAIGLRLFELRFGKTKIASDAEIKATLGKAYEGTAGDTHFAPGFLFSEFKEVIDAWQITDHHTYINFARLGRKTRLPEPKRTILWEVFEKTKSDLHGLGLVTYAEIFWNLANDIEASGNSPFDYAVVDEAQDINPAQLRFLSAVAGRKPNGLFFAGDLGQRIFQLAFSWKSLGVDIRGRSRTLKVNYRTSHQIRSRADLLLGPSSVDVDGNNDDRRGTVSVFEGPPPQVEEYDSPEVETASVAVWLNSLRSEGFAPHEIAIFVRSDAEIGRAEVAAQAANLESAILDEFAETVAGKMSIATMHLAKGLEFRAVAVIACDDEIIPSQQRINTVVDQADLKEVYDTERHLLYVACTRARDRLLVTSGGYPSEFLADIGVINERS